jgi:hypothetical protein
VRMRPPYTIASSSLVRLVTGPDTRGVAAAVVGAREVSLRQVLLAVLDCAVGAEVIAVIPAPRVMLPAVVGVSCGAGRKDRAPIRMV